MLSKTASPSALSHSRSEGDSGHSCHCRLNIGRRIAYDIRCPPSLPRLRNCQVKRRRKYTCCSILLRMRSLRETPQSLHNRLRWMAFRPVMSLGRLDYRLARPRRGCFAAKYRLFYGAAPHLRIKNSKPTLPNPRPSPYFLGFFEDNDERGLRFARHGRVAPFGAQCGCLGAYDRPWPMLAMLSLPYTGYAHAILCWCFILAYSDSNTSLTSISHMESGIDTWASE